MILLAVSLLAMVLVGVMLMVRSHRQHTDAYLYYKRPLVGGIARRAIDKDVYHIGRQADNELRLRDRTVSRHHAEIVRNRNGTHFIRDLDSVNGVSVGRRHVHSSMLHDGDIISVGSVRLRFRSFAGDHALDTDTVVTEEHDHDRFSVKRRRAERLKVKVGHAHVFSEVSGWIEAIVHDLSQDGALVEVFFPFELRTPVDLVFPMQTEEARRWLRLLGEVVRVDDAMVGIAFQEVDRRTHELLEALLTRRPAPGESSPTPPPGETVKLARGPVMPHSNRIH